MSGGVQILMKKPLDFFDNPEVGEAKYTQRGFFQELENTSQEIAQGRALRAMMLSYAPNMTVRWMNLTGKPRKSLH